jgi:predicted dehydrogenase
MLRTVGVGIIGLGFVGSGAHLPALAKIKNAKIVALSDVVESVLEKQAAKYGVPAIYRDYNELLKNSEVEAVIIATPTPFHTTIALAALKAGKHVICEMPLAPTLEEVDMVNRLDEMATWD